MSPILNLVAAALYSFGSHSVMVAALTVAGIMHMTANAINRDVK